MPDKISVLLPVAERAPSLPEALESLIGQTYRHFRLLLLAQDQEQYVTKVLKTFPDKRIYPLSFPEKTGMVNMLNWALAEADTEFILFADTDDIAFPGRLRSLYDYMTENEEVDICGSQVSWDGQTHEAIQYPLFHDNIVSSLLFYNPLCTSTAMIRTRIFSNEGFRFRDIFPRLEEYDLWCRAIGHCCFHNVPEILVRKTRLEYLDEATKEEKLPLLSSFYIEKLNWFGIRPSEEELKLHIDLFDLKRVSQFEEPQKYRDWLDKILQTNESTKKLPWKALEQEVDMLWHNLFDYMLHSSPKLARHYLKSQGKSDSEILLFMAKHKMKSLGTKKDK